MPRITQRVVLGAAVATSGTFTVSYPTGYTAGHFRAGKKHRLVALQRLMEAPKDFTIAFGAASATVTYLGATTIPAGQEVFVEMDTADMSEPDYTSRRGLTTNQLGQQRIMFENTVAVNLGSPAAGTTAGLRAAASHAGGALTLITAALTLDAPRNIQITSSGNESGVTYTVTGKDEYNVTVVEAITGPNATTVQGNKAFKSITSISASGASAGNVSIGPGNKLGFPVFVPGAGSILREILDNAVATAGTLAAGATGTATATTGDTRGTYIPNSAPDGTRTFEIVLYLADPTYLGAPQFGG